MRREQAAKALCQVCPVRAECAAHALAAREPYGVWGGFTETERIRLLAAGWEDLADRVHKRVDICRLESRLGLRAAAAPNARIPSSSGVHGQRQVSALTAPVPRAPTRVMPG